MKKFICVIAVCVMVLSGCSGEDNVDVGKTGMIRLPDGEIITGKIEALNRWSSSSYEVKIDGTVYCVHPYAFACYEESDHGKNGV